MKVISNNKPRNAVCYCFDWWEKFFLPAMTSLYSLLSNNSLYHQWDFYFIVDQSNDKIERWVWFLKNIFLNLSLTVKSHGSDVWESLSKKGSFPPASFYRLDLAVLFADVHECVLYLDADTLVLWDIKDLFEQIKWNGKPCCAVPDHDLYNRYFFKRYPYLIKQSKLWRPPTYNSWVLGINTLKFIESRFRDLCIRFGSAQPVLALPDQDMMSGANILVEWSLIESIDPKYNLHSWLLRYRKLNWFYWFEEQIKNAITNPVIRHYTWLNPWIKLDKINVVGDYCSWRKKLIDFDNERGLLDVPYDTMHDKYFAFMDFMHNNVITNQEAFFKFWLAVRVILYHKVSKNR